MNNKKCVIFDLDGTLLDTLEDLKNSVNFALSQGGYNERTLDEVREFVGNGIENLMRKAVPVGISEEEFTKCFASFKEHYKIHSEDNTKEYDGITDMLRVLKQNGFLLAVVSNKADFAVETLCNKYFQGLLDVAVGEREGIKRKPCPDSVNEVTRILGVSKENCYYVGDSDVDVKTAHNAEMKCIACTWGFRSRSVLESEKPEYIIDNVNEILEIVGV
ncbi:MAG: HAD family hydrolase [Ruminococcaceae bacterium]|nr:HAD family hydrolase [Oscillospiraceae bacterium]